MQQLAKSDQGDREPSGHEIPRKKEELAQLQTDRKTAERNLALAESDAHFKAIAGVLDELTERQKKLESEIQDLTAMEARSPDPDVTINALLAVVERLVELDDSPAKMQSAQEIFALTHLRLFLRFQPVKLKKRTVNRVRGGVVTFGDAAAPVKLYERLRPANM